MKNIKLICQVLQLNAKNKKLKPETKLSEFLWDSMAMISLISLINEKYGKTVSTKKIRSLKKLKDLDNLISKKIKT